MTTVLAIALLACGDDETGTTSRDTGTATLDSGDTQDTQDTQDTAPSCVIAVSDTEPQAGDDDVFWRDPLQVWFDGSFDGLSLPELQLAEEAGGTTVVHGASWDEGLAQVLLTPVEPLLPLTDYTLSIDACDQNWSVPFSTSDLGSPVEGGAESLLGRTWVLEMGKVTWTRPENVEELLNAFFTEPLLVGVQAVDGDTLDLLVALGRFTDMEGFKQRKQEPTWDILDVDLSHGAWFEAQAEVILFAFEEVEIPVHHFALQGTFAPDGTSIVGAALEGLIDTRNLSMLFNLDQEDFICTTYAADYNLECTDCPDGELLCLDLKGEDIQADEQPGLTLVRNDEGDSSTE